MLRIRFTGRAVVVLKVPNRDRDLEEARLLLPRWVPGSEFADGCALGVRTAAFVSGLPPNLLRPNGFSELAPFSAGLIVVGAAVVVVEVEVVVGWVLVETGRSFGRLSVAEKMRRQNVRAQAFSRMHSDSNASEIDRDRQIEDRG